MNEIKQGLKNKKILELPFIVMILLIVCIILFTSGCLGMINRGSPLVTGEWDGDVFTNEWTNITFELPQGFHIVSTDEFDMGRSEVYDFLIRKDDDMEVSIALFYIDVTFGEQAEHTAEDYLNIMREQLAHSRHTFTFADEFEHETIAGKEYAVMRSVVAVNADPADTFLQDGYAHRFVNTMIVILTTYAEDTRVYIDEFISSIEQVN